MMKTCARCNAPNNDTASTCQYCGAAFPPPPNYLQPNANPQMVQIHNYYQSPADAVYNPIPPTAQSQYYTQGYAPYPQPYPPMMGYPPAPDPAVAKNQRKIQKLIAYYAQRGYKVVSQTDTTVQLTKEKSFSCLLAVLLLLLWVVPFFLYLILYASKKEERLLITLNPDGSTTFAFNDDKPLTNYPVNGEMKIPNQNDNSLFIALIAGGILCILIYLLVTGSIFGF